MEKKVYLIYTDSIDDAAAFKGYIYGTEEDAKAYCRKLRKEEWFWDDCEWIELDCLNPDA